MFIREKESDVGQKLRSTSREKKLGDIISEDKKIVFSYS